MNWQENLVTTAAAIGDVIRESRRIAVLGIKTEAQADQPAFYVRVILSEPASKLSPYPSTTRK